MRCKKPVKSTRLYPVILTVLGEIFVTTGLADDALKAWEEYSGLYP